MNYVHFKETVDAFSRMTGPVVGGAFANFGFKMQDLPEPEIVEGKARIVVHYETQDREQCTDSYLLTAKGVVEYARMRAGKLEDFPGRNISTTFNNFLRNREFAVFGNFEGLPARFAYMPEGEGHIEYHENSKPIRAVISGLPGHDRSPLLEARMNVTVLEQIGPDLRARRGTVYNPDGTINVESTKKLVAALAPR